MPGLPFPRTGQERLGPSLAGIVGKKAGADPQLQLLAGSQESTVLWDVATLDAYLMDPQKMIPGNKMPFPGLKTENERRR